MTGEIQNKSDAIEFAFLDGIKKRLDRFTPRQRAFAEFVCQNPESIAFLSITDLSKKAGVSEATIVRFCNLLGYNGYSQLSCEAKQTVQAGLEVSGRFQLVRRMRKESPVNSSASSFERLVNGEIENLINLGKNIRTNDFYKCVDMISKADRICVIGCMASTSLAGHFSNMLSTILLQVDTIYEHNMRSSAIINRLTAKSLVFLISFPRYPRATVKLGGLVADKGTKIVAVTDSHLSPVVPHADLSFILPQVFISVVDTYASPMTFLNSLAMELINQSPEKTKKALAKYDEYVKTMDLFLPALGKKAGKSRH